MARSLKEIMQDYKKTADSDAEATRLAQEAEQKRRDDMARKQATMREFKAKQAEAVSSVLGEIKREFEALGGFEVSLTVPDNIDKPRQVRITSHGGGSYTEYADYGTLLIRYASQHNYRVIRFLFAGAGQPGSRMYVYISTKAGESGENNLALFKEMELKTPENAADYDEAAREALDAIQR